MTMHSALYAASLAPLLTQEHRFGGAIYLTGCRAFDEVLPVNFVVAQNFDGIGCTIRYARSADEQLGMLVEQRSRSTFVRLSGSTAESVAEMLARLRDLEEKVVKRERDRQQYRLWHLGGGGPESMTRKFSSVRWEDVASNYPSSTRPICATCSTSTVQRDRGASSCGAERRGRARRGPSRRWLRPGPTGVTSTSSPTASASLTRRTT